MPEIHPFLPANQFGKWYNNNNLHLGVPQPRADWFVNADSFAFMPSEDVGSLFLGTFPTCQVVNQLRTGGNTEFFYGQRENSFWSLIELLSGQSTATEINQFQLLHQTSFGLTDILKSTDRNGKGSGDKDLLQPWKFNNLLNLRKHFQKIERIYCTSGGMGKVTSGSGVNAARWLLNSLQNAGYKVTGFNLKGYNKHITVYSGNLIVWKFELYNLLSPSDSGNTGFQGQINADPQLQMLIANLPLAFAGYGDPMKLRIAQWSYLLSLGGFQLVPFLQAYIVVNNLLLATKFS
jgi:G:T/U-mismatch repair DNA glycosylase